MLILLRHSFDPKRRDPALSRIVITPGSGPVRVTVLEADGGVVRIGFEADGETQIYREEKYNAIKRDGNNRPTREAP